jgi:hypothetical protein
MLLARHLPKDIEDSQRHPTLEGLEADYSLVQSYRVISLLNCLSKVVKKIAAKAIA